MSVSVILKSQRCEDALAALSSWLGGAWYLQALQPGSVGWVGKSFVRRGEGVSAAGVWEGAG